MCPVLYKVVYFVQCIVDNGGGIIRRLDEDPFATALDELVKQHGQVREHESTNVETKEFASMTSAKLETDMCG